jgi:hypothetical protein
MRDALWAELVFTIAAGVGGLFMFILADPARARPRAAWRQGPTRGRNGGLAHLLRGSSHRPSPSPEPTGRPPELLGYFLVVAVRAAGVIATAAWWRNDQLVVGAAPLAARLAVCPVVAVDILRSRRMQAERFITKPAESVSLIDAVHQIDDLYLAVLKQATHT